MLPILYVSLSACLALYSLNFSDPTADVCWPLLLCLAAAEFAADLYEFDPADLCWRVLNSSTGIGGKAPSARSGHGFAGMGGEVFVFGGTDRRDRGDILLGGGLVGVVPPNRSTLDFGLLVRKKC